MENMNIRRDKVGGGESTKEARMEKSKIKQMFDPRRTKDVSPNEIGSFYTKLHGINPKSVIFTGIASQIKQANTDDSMPPTIQEVAEMTIAQCTGQEDHALTTKKCVENLRVTDVQRNTLQCATKDQASSTNWFEHRYGRITGSKVKRCSK